MKRNLYILHTQYNLILGVGVMLKFHQDEINDLIVYPEFSITTNMKTKLEKLFSKVYYVREKFEPVQRGLKNINEVSQQVKKCRAFLSNPYDEVIISQDRLFEDVICQDIKRANPHCIISAVEEDVYYSLNENSVDRLTVLQRVKSVVRNIVVKISTGACLNTDEIKPCFGSSAYIDRIYVVFAKCVRNDLQEKQLVEFERFDIEKSIRNLYACKEKDSNQEYTVVIASDLIERYKEKEKVIQAFSLIGEWCKENNVKMQIKYHPRETQKLQLGDRAVEIPYQVAIENLLMQWDSSKTAIIGNASTSIYMAKKMGYPVISILKMSSGEKQIEEAYKKMGVYTPSNVEDLIAVLNQWLRDDK